MSQEIGTINYNKKASVDSRNAVLGKGKTLPTRIVYKQAADFSKDKNYGDASNNASGASINTKEPALQHIFMLYILDNLKYAFNKPFTDINILRSWDLS